jgi:hypothetical protein
MGEEVDNFHHFGLGALVAGDVVEVGGRTRLVVELGLRFSDSHNGAELLAALAGHPHEQGDDDHDGQQVEGDAEERRPTRLVPVTTTLWLRRSGERVTSLSAVRTWEVYVPPPTILPVTAPADEIVAVEILPAWTSPTKAL